MTRTIFPRRVAALLLAAIVGAAAFAPRALAVPLAASNPREGRDYEWFATTFDEARLNAHEQFSMKAEYAAYAPGVEVIYVQLYNGTGQPATYGVGFFLERKAKSGWQQVRQVERKNGVVIAFPSDGYELPASGTRGCATNIATWTGPLPAGSYRVIKPILSDADPSQDIWVSAEFSIQKGGYDGSSVSGYKQLGELPVGYSVESALADGVFLIDAKGKVQNADMLYNFLEKTVQEVPGKLRMMLPDGSTILDVANNPGLPNFQVETRSAEGKVATEYYTYIALKKSGGKTRLVLCNSLGKQYQAGRELVLLKDTKLADRKKIAAYGKAFFESDGDFRVYGPGGYSEVLFRNDKESGKRISWNYAPQDGSAIRGSGKMQLSEFGKDAADVVDMAWKDGKTVEIRFGVKGKVKKTVLLDVEAGKVVEE